MDILNKIFSAFGDTFSSRMQELFTNPIKGIIIIVLAVLALRLFYKHGFTEKGDEIIELSDILTPWAASNNRNRRPNNNNNRNNNRNNNSGGGIGGLLSKLNPFGKKNKHNNNGGNMNNQPRNNNSPRPPMPPGGDRPYMGGQMGGI